MYTNMVCHTIAACADSAAARMTHLKQSLFDVFVDGTNFFFNKLDVLHELL
jgi:hypothetical protein